MTTEPISQSAPIHVAGHTGLVGSAIVRRLHADGFTNLLLPARAEVDLRDQAAVHAWYHDVRPQYVFLAAGTVGGIWPNLTYPADFLYDNLLIHANVVHAAHLTEVAKLLYLGSSCIYPRNCPQPMREEYLLTGPLEPTNEAYAVAKIAGIKLCQAYRRQRGSNFISVLPTNVYGPYDNFDLTDAHVLPALIRKFHEAARAGASSVTIWGTGAPRREFLHVDDLADACLHLMRTYESEEPVNVGTGVDVSIRELGELLRRIVAPGVELVFDGSKPDGMPFKRLDVSKAAALGWRARIELEDGIRSTVAWFAAHYEEAVAQRRHGRS